MNTTAKKRNRTPLPCLIFLFAAFLAPNPAEAQDGIERISLAGDWNVVLDPSDTGIADRWYGERYPESILLPDSGF